MLGKTKEEKESYVIQNIIRFKVCINDEGNVVFFYRGPERETRKLVVE